MPLGILDDRTVEHVPGTSPLSELGRDVETPTDVDRGLLKHDASGNIVLIPQPSDSPKDPYNWPRWKKEMFTVTMGYGCGCVGAIGPLLTSAIVPLAESFDMPLQQFTLGLQGSCIAAIGVSSLVCNSLAVKIGKRPIYIITAIGLMVTCFWAAESKSFASLAAARAVQGFCMAPMEALVPASIADIWFVHERGYRTAVFNLGVLGGINVASPIAGSIIQHSSWRICLHAMGGAFAVQVILTILFMPESAYHRTGTIEFDTGDEGNKGLVVDESEKPGIEHEERRTSSVATPATAEKPKSFLRELLPWDGYYERTSFWRLFFKPLYVLISPVVAWATLLYTTSISWLVLLTITLSQIFSAPPYSFSVSSVGACNLASFVASLIGTAIAGPLTDGVVTYMSKLNKGIFEPEFRLLVLSALMIFTATGFFAWGETLYRQDPWPVPVIVCLGMINLGVQLGTTGLVTYVVDCHRHHAAEAFAAMSFIKNMFAFGMTFYSNDWIAVQGVRGCFFVIGGITMAVTLTTVPMYIYGKRARAFTFKHRLLARLDEVDVVGSQTGSPSRSR